VLALVVAGGACRFLHGAPGLAGDDAELDGPSDASRDAPGDIAQVTPDARPIADCENDSSIVLCYSFDQNPLPAMIANEASVTANATVTNAMSIASPGKRAARVDATSEIYVPYTATVTGVMSMEVWFRVDTDASAGGGREGLFDSNVGAPNNMSLFFYNQSPSPHQLRCGLGSGVISLDAPTFPTGQWLYAACTCDGGAIHIYLNGTSLGSSPQNCAAGGALSNPDGLTIGSNNNGGPTGIDAQLLGALDGIKMWSTVLSPTEICAHAGRTGC
jgi:hypothetical protein